MKDVSFHEIIISRDDQRIISADAEVYDALGDFVVKPMYELIAVEDMEIYKKNIKNCDGTFYPSKILAPDTMYYTYMRAQDDNDLIRLTVVNAQDFLNAHSSLMKAINAYRTQLDLYEDVFFEYDKDLGTVEIYNTERAYFDTGTYSISEFEELLLAKADEEQRHAVKSFITQVKSGVGRSTTIIDGNILSDDPSVTHTVLDEAFIFYGANSEGVVGHIQLRRDNELIKVNDIKHDSLTGLIDKTDIIRIAKERIDDRRLEGTAVAIIDVDFFKSVNDSYGHQFGDEVIKKVADIISNEVGTHGVSGRFGGDEFFIVLYNIMSEDQIRPILKGIKNKVSSTFPDKGMDKDTPLSVSIGAAVFPNDADCYDDLFMLADHCLYLAKKKGRNRYIVYTREKHGTMEDIKLKNESSGMANERDVSCGDVIVRMFDTALHNKDNNYEKFMNEFAETFEFQNVMLFEGNPFKFRYATGSSVINDQDAIDFVLGILNSEAKEKYFSLGDFVVINRLEMLPPHAHAIKDFLVNRGIYSLLIIRFFDINQKECILIITSVGKKNQWNQYQFKYYRAFTDLLSLLSINS
ncbi:GGDEF domain-containing protein [Butyrivibrio sp. XBB1001]|uniref:GGDEF domain-containing protein n=1 Tax=Butyrivibrio sp. XBB1001 TaxID=1280682 RepID=UPI000400F10D|nr:GGDEF domain-containing protein [Butyrivibrio sp. XBB1001]